MFFFCSSVSEEEERVREEEGEESLLAKTAVMATSTGSGNEGGTGANRASMSVLAGASRVKRRGKLVECNS